MISLNGTKANHKSYLKTVTVMTLVILAALGVNVLDLGPVVRGLATVYRPPGGLGLRPVTGIVRPPDSSTTTASKGHVQNVTA